MAASFIGANLLWPRLFSFGLDPFLRWSFIIFFLLIWGIFSKYYLWTRNEERYEGFYASRDQMRK